jgi:hypothetical protein
MLYDYQEWIDLGEQEFFEWHDNNLDIPYNLRMAWDAGWNAARLQIERDTK